MVGQKSPAADAKFWVILASLYPLNLASLEYSREGSSCSDA